jgi:SulP family sulfate permease
LPKQKITLDQESSAHLMKSIFPKLGALCVVAMSISWAYFLNGASLNPPQVEGLATVGFIPNGLPSPRWVPAMPRTLGVGVSLLMSAVPIALVGFAESTAIAKSSTKLGGGDPKLVREDDELLALAACNAFTQWVGGYPVTGSFSRTAINAESGARSAISTAVAALAVVIVLLFITPVLALLPKAAVSAIVLTAVLRLVDVAELSRLYNSYKSTQSPQATRDLSVFVLVFLTSLIFGVELGLLVGVVVHRTMATSKV